MVTVYVAHRQNLEGRRQIVRAIVVWGGSESVNPEDFGLQSIEWFSIGMGNMVRGSTVALPHGSLYHTRKTVVSGAAIAGGPAPGSALSLVWLRGSTGTRFATSKVGIGTIISTGSKSAPIEVLGY